MMLNLPLENVFAKSLISQREIIKEPELGEVTLWRDVVYGIGWISPAAFPSRVQRSFSVSGIERLTRTSW